MCSSSDAGVLVNPAVTIGTAGAAVGSGYLQYKEAKKAREEAEKERKRLQAEQQVNMATEQREKFSKKKQEFDTSRQTVRRGRSRGRASTILDKSENLG
jgi:uncharacterized membrane protein YdbT with pleckstrin-like domain